MLVWNVPFVINGTHEYESEPLNFFYSPTGNIAVPVFEPSYQTTVPLGFDAENKMFVYNYVDDTVTLLNGTGRYKTYLHWAACQTYCLGHTHLALAWVTIG
jgi:hypothetical protein